VAETEINRYAVAYRLADSATRRTHAPAGDGARQSLSGAKTRREITAKETRMRYETKKDLPPTITQVLPKDAQQVYLDVYNKAWDEYEQEGTGDLSRHSIAHRQAWETIEREFARDLNTDEWEVKSEGSAEYDARSFLDKVREAIAGLFS
jgi:cation transport regulator